MNKYEYSSKSHPQVSPIFLMMLKHYKVKGRSQVSKFFSSNGKCKIN